MQPIKVGVLDSGAGGLTVLAAILAAQKDIELHYYADDAFAPYGSLPVLDMQQRVISICQYLIDAGVSALVIACNTATLETITLVRNLPIVQGKAIHIIGIEPAIKPASLLPRLGQEEQGVISVLATPVTCNSARLKALMEQNQRLSHVDGTIVFLRYQCIASAVLANAIDALPTSIELVKQELQRIKGEMQRANSRVLVLACTHYPLIRPMFEALFDYPIAIIEPSQAVANRLLECIELSGFEADKTNIKRPVYLYSSGSAPWVERLPIWLNSLLDEGLFNGLDFTLKADCQVNDPLLSPHP